MIIKAILGGVANPPGCAKLLSDLKYFISTNICIDNKIRSLGIRYIYHHRDQY